MQTNYCYFFLHNERWGLKAKSLLCPHPWKDNCKIILESFLHNSCQLCCTFFRGESFQRAVYWFNILSVGYAHQENNSAKKKLCTTNFLNRLPTFSHVFIVTKVLAELYGSLCTEILNLTDLQLLYIIISIRNYGIGVWNKLWHIIHS